jgi:transcriptional regulator with XRE-family HTH domain
MSDKIKSFGETVRDLRENKGLLLRQVAALLEVDTAFLSKWNEMRKGQAANKWSNYQRH